MNPFSRFLARLSEIVYRREDRKFEFRVCIMKDGVDSWGVVRGDSLTFKYADSYEVEPNCLYELALTMKLKIRHWNKRIKNTFIIIFRDGSPKGLVYQEPNRTAYTLKVVEESKALGMALKEEFREAFTGKKIFLVIVLAIVVGAVVLILTGQVSMG